MWCRAVAARMFGARVNARVAVVVPQSQGVPGSISSPHRVHLTWPLATKDTSAARVRRCSACPYFLFRSPLRSFEVTRSS